MTRRLFLANAIMGTTLACTHSARAWQLTIVDPKDTVALEHSDRKARLLRLAAQAGIASPEFYEYVIPKNAHGLGNYDDIPVLRVIFRNDVLFDFDKDDLKDTALPALNVVRESFAREANDVAVFVAGHTDWIDTEEYNLNLGMRRAAAVGGWLVANGVGQAQVFLVSFGKAVPIDTNETDYGRSRNRRVEFLISARPHAIAAWLANQKATICVSHNSLKDSNCPKSLEFIPRRIVKVTMQPAVQKTNVSIDTVRKVVSPQAKKETVTLDTPKHQITLAPAPFVIDLKINKFVIVPQ
jgi:outer membrane protein OmpA-like peptidoglycan-associated protein